MQKNSFASSSFFQVRASKQGSYRLDQTKASGAVRRGAVRRGAVPRSWFFLDSRCRGAYVATVCFHFSRLPARKGCTMVLGRCRHRCGFSALSLVVIVAIILFLLALLIPAVARVRQAAER